MKKTPCCFAIVLLTFIQTVFSQLASIHFDKASPKQLYAASRLEKILPVSYQVNLIINSQLLPESFTIKSLGKTITVTGGDERVMR